MINYKEIKIRREKAVCYSIWGIVLYSSEHTPRAEDTHLQILKLVISEIMGNFNSANKSR